MLRSFRHHQSPNLTKIVVVYTETSALVVFTFLRVCLQMCVRFFILFFLNFIRVMICI